MDENRRVTDESPSPRESGPIRVRGRGRHAAAARANNTKNAGRWVLAIAILQVVFGVIFGISNSREADRTLQRFANSPADEVYEHEGEQYTIAELRVAIEKERLQVFVVPIGLGVLFVALYVWSRKSPVPAIGSALGLFVTVHAVEAVLDPVSLARGVIFKVLCVIGLARGVKSALEERAIANQLEAEAGDGSTQ